MAEQQRKYKIIKSLTITFVIMLICMLLFETVKMLIFPQISIWKSHFLTIGFSTIAATFAGFFVIRIYENLYQKTLHEIKERKQAQELLAKAYDDLEKRIDERTSELSEFNLRLQEEVTIRKQTDDALRRSEERFSRIFHNAPVAIAIGTLDEGRMLMVNDSFVRLMEYEEKGEVQGKTINDLHIWADELKWNSLRKHLLQDNTAPYTVETQVRTNLGELRDVLLSVEKIDLSGRPGVLSMMLDITGRKEAEKNLVSAKEVAEEMDRFKTSLLANISNEVREPLNEILKAASKLAYDYDDPRISDIASSIYQRGEHVFKTINGILDLAEVEADSKKLHLQVKDIRAVVEEIADRMRPQAQEKKVDLIIDKSQVPVLANIDAVLFEHAMVNLLGNAITFTNEGNIHVKIRPKEKYGHKYAEIKIQDTGVGIREEMLPFLFDAVKPDHVTPRDGKKQAYRLGLPITRRMINLMNGTIRVKSQEGEGSIFTIRLPLVNSEQTVNVKS